MNLSIDQVDTVLDVYKDLVHTVSLLYTCEASCVPVSAGACTVYTFLPMSLLLLNYVHVIKTARKTVPHVIQGTPRHCLCCCNGTGGVALVVTTGRRKKGRKRNF
jgi:hypothetical protein